MSLHPQMLSHWETLPFKYIWLYVIYAVTQFKHLVLKLKTGSGIRVRFLVMNALASLVSQISGGWNTLWAIAQPISLSLMWVGSCFLGGPENAAKSCEEVLCFFRFLIASIGFTPTESRMFYLPALKKKGRRVLFHSNESEMRVTTLHTHTLYTSQIEGVQSCVPLPPD